MKKDIIKFILLTLVIYNIIPIINKIVPESTNYTFLSDLWIVYPLYSLIISVLFCKKYGLKIMVSILLVLLFIPTMFIFYNDSVLIFIFIYLILSIIGCFIGNKINEIFTYKSKSINDVKTDEINIVYTILQEEAIVLWDSQGGFR